MGFGSLAVQIVMFVTVLTIAVGIVILINVNIQETSQALTLQKDRLSDQLRTDITITSLSYNTTTDVLTAYVENTGKTKVRMNTTDLYVNGLRVQYTNRTIAVENDTDLGSPLIWDPSEIISIVSTQTLTSGIHTVRVVTDNGISDQDQFST